MTKTRSGRSENPYWQHFSGERHFRHKLPCDASSQVRWRQLIGEAGCEWLLARAGCRDRVVEYLGDAPALHGVHWQVVCCRGGCRPGPEASSYMRKVVAGIWCKREVSASGRFAQPRVMRQMRERHAEPTACARQRSRSPVTECLLPGGHTCRFALTRRMHALSV